MSEITEAAERLLNEESRHFHVRNGSEDLAVDCADVLTVARFVLDGEREVARVQARGDVLAGVVRYYLENMHTSDAHPDDLAAALHDWEAAAFAAPTTAAGGSADPDSGGRGE